MAIRAIDGALDWAIDDVTGKLHVINQDGSDAGEIDFNVAAASGNISSLAWKFKITTTATDPLSTFFQMNNVIPASVTELYVSTDGGNGLDFQGKLEELSAGIQIYVQQGDDTSKAILFTIVSVTDNTGWFTVDAQNARTVRESVVYMCFRFSAGGALFILVDFDVYIKIGFPGFSAFLQFFD